MNVGFRQSNQIYNFWVQGLNSSTKGEVLVTNGRVKWVPVGRGDPLPDAAVYSGRDKNGYKVWVGRTTVSGEPGMITCSNSDSETPQMWNLWSHNEGRSSKAQLLTILRK